VGLALRFSTFFPAVFFHIPSKNYTKTRFSPMIVRLGYAKGLTVLGGNLNLYRTLLLKLLHGEPQTFSAVGNVINQQRFFACNIRDDELG